MDRHISSPPDSSPFEPHAERIATAATDDVKLAPAILIPLIIDVMPRVLACLSELKANPRSAAAKARAAGRENRDLTRLARHYWNRSRLRIEDGRVSLTWDQARVLAQRTIDAAFDVPDAELAGLTTLAVSVVAVSVVAATGNEAGGTDVGNED